MHPSLVIVAGSGCPPDFMADQLTARNFPWTRTVPGAPAIAVIGGHAPGLVIVHSGTESESRVLATIGHIRNQFPFVSVFLVTQRSSESLAIGALKAGVEDYFGYPFRETDLLASIEHQHAPVDERKRIISVLLETNWNKSTAAKKLNWSRMTLYRKMGRHQIIENRAHRSLESDPRLAV